MTCLSSRMFLHLKGRGFSGLCIALLALGVHFYGLAAESSPIARACSQHTMPSLVHVDDVADVSVESLLPFLQRRRVRGVIIGGGSPCQQSRKGLSDPRGSAPKVLHSLVASFRDHPAFEGLQIISFLENVASAPQDVIQQYSAWLGCPPVRSDAACCGWTSRDRLYWLTSQSKDASSAEPPQPWVYQHDGKAAALLVYTGQKPIPSRVFLEDGFPMQVMKGEVPAAHTLTREFYHPSDLVHKTTPEAADRFFSDARRFPPASYEDHSLLWRGQEWRQPSPEERSQFLGVPAAATTAVTGRHAHRVRDRNCLLGNGFHSPTIMILMSMIPQLCHGRCTIPSGPQEALNSRICNTV